MAGIVKALVVDDHPLVAQATKNLLLEIEEIKVIDIAINAKQCMEYIHRFQPQLVFLDYQLPDQSGIEITEQIMEKYPDIHIVIFSGIEITELYNTFINLKVSGILSKESSERTIKNMVSCILDNSTVLPLPIFHKMQLSTANSGDQYGLLHEEIEMMSMLVKGSTHEQIAEKIHMSKRTVDNYLKKIYEKLNVKTRLEAIETFIKSKYYN